MQSSSSSSSSYSPPSPPQQQPFKVVLIGNTSSGKTSLRTRFVKGDFRINYRATIGCDFLIKTIKVDKDPLVVVGKGKGKGKTSGEDQESRQVELSLWDTAGQERFKSISQPFYRNSLACIIVFDYPSAKQDLTKTLEEIKVWFEEFKGKCNTLTETKDEEFCWIFVGNKLDLVEENDQEEKEREKVERKLRKEIESWFKEERGIVNEEEKKKKKKSKTRLEIDPSPTTTNHSSEPIQVPTSSTSSSPHSSSTTIRPSLSSRTSTSSNQSISLSSSIPLPQVLNPKSLLLMSTSPPVAPSSVEPLGHPKAVYLGGPFNSNEGRLLDEDESERTDNHKEEEMEAEEQEVEEADEEEEEEEEDYSKIRFKLFTTSAKTGQGVNEVFEYCARRILYNLSIAELSSNLNSRNSSNENGVIKINERETDLTTSQKIKRACCT